MQLAAAFVQTLEQLLQNRLGERCPLEVVADLLPTRDVPTELDELVHGGAAEPLNDILGVGGHRERRQHRDDGLGELVVVAPHHLNAVLARQR